MFIIEGSDHLGKTTAAQRIVQLAAERASLGMRLLEYMDADCLEVHQHPRPVRYAHMTRQNKAFDFLDDYQDMLSRFAVQDRFHIGALIWHDGVMDQDSLKLVESWLYALGSYVVIFACPDEDWYRHRLKGMQQMFDVDALVAANDKYLQIVAGTFSVDVQYDAAFSVGPSYPCDSLLRAWLDSWYRRINKCSM